MLVFRYNLGVEVIWKSVVPITVMLMYAPVGESTGVTSEVVSRVSKVYSSSICLSWVLAEPGKVVVVNCITC